MKRKQLQDRHERKLKREATLLMLGAVGSLLLGLFVLFLTFWSTYGILLFTTYWFLPWSHTLLMTCSGLFLLLLFIGNATTERTYLDKIELNLGPHRDLEVAVAFGTGFGSALAFQDMKATRSTIKMFTTLLYTGPRIVVASWQMVKRALMLKRINLHYVTPVIAKAYRADSRVSLETLLEDEHEATHQIILEHLLSIDGVVLLKSEPPGITLAPALVQELQQD